MPLQGISLLILIQFASPLLLMGGFHQLLMRLLLLLVSLSTVDGPPIKLFVILAALLPKVFSPFLLFSESSPSALGWRLAPSGAWSQSCVPESKLSLLVEQQASESETGVEARNTTLFGEPADHALWL